MQEVTTQRSWKEKQRQEREEQILRVAEEVLLEKGYHETSMDEIATRVGIAKGTVYLHFPSKEDLVTTLFERDMLKFFQNFDATIAPESTASAKLEAILRLMYGGVYSRRMRLLYSMYNSADMRRIFQAKKVCMLDMWEQVSQRINSLLEEGKTSGEFDATLPTNVMLHMFLSLLSPRGFERLIVEGHMSAEELAHYLAQIYFKGIHAH
ncbi:MAG: TetR/AcrR family transcriptional regulator [Ktedonobacteraceae bacterium]|nr:TetR/AcrR family transcriptional regulator [Chloroflexota bacterium]